jgi:hypothetical protein
MRTAAVPLSRFGLVAATVLFGAGFASLARANDVYWSVGVVSPGVSVAVSNSRPVLVPAPIYAPVYVQSAPVYMRQAPVYTRPAPIFVQPQVVYVQPAGHGFKGWHRGHKENAGHKHRRDDERRGDTYGHGPQVYGYAPGWR